MNSPDQITAWSTFGIFLLALLIGIAEWRRYRVVRLAEEDRTMRAWRAHAARLVAFEQDGAVTVLNTSDAPFYLIRFTVYALPSGSTTGEFVYHHNENQFDLLPSESRTLKVMRSTNPQVMDNPDVDLIDCNWDLVFCDHDENRWWFSPPFCLRLLAWTAVNDREVLDSVRLLTEDKFTARRKRLTRRLGTAFEPGKAPH